MSEFDTDAFWTSDENRAFYNPGVALAPEEVPDCSALNEQLLFRTSGASGGPKWVCLSREAVLASATSVNHFVKSTANDHWLRALPEFHVGGFSIHARGWTGNYAVSILQEKWDPGRLESVCRDRQVTLLSLVPTQVHDLVVGDWACPESIRMVIVGGAALDQATRTKAQSLGWPIRESYGMTETSSQVATEGEGGELKILDLWKTRQHPDTGALEVKGAALFSGYLEDGRVCFPGSDGWFSTGDRVLLERGGRTLRFQGRIANQVKILGEWVDLDLRTRMIGDSGALRADEFLLIDLPDERRGVRLVLVVEMSASQESVEQALEVYQQNASPFELIDEVIRLDALPRSSLGKPLREKVRSRASALSTHSRASNS